ncbi:hypothetical protein RM543_17775 [Roseicyclus sp. F158]|uniref:Sulfotransferase family protein n=1 Tax=Tropicimonas omnivorans TaxID=3075590 RepID=A0ABU3DLC6_9RHOB|nr:hypothetical protein [Roseicyclus sp. F158]MDT0684525.1 hypothetical protein [Roseicyclus sp. F158]
MRLITMGSPHAPVGPAARFAEGAGWLGFAIIGVQKASITSIQDYLHAHPAVCLPMGEIPCFESPDYEQAPASVQRSNIFPDHLAVQRLMRHSPGCKLIVVLRDQVERPPSGEPF